MAQPHIQRDLDVASPSTGRQSSQPTSRRTARKREGLPGNQSPSLPNSPGAMPLLMVWSLAARKAAPPPA